MRCPECAKYLTPSEMKVHQCGPDVDQREPDGCLRCGAGLTSMGTHDFRFGGMTGGFKLLLGEWAELNEEKLRLEVLACPDCRRVELRVAR